MKTQIDFFLRYGFLIVGIFFLHGCSPSEVAAPSDLMQPEPDADFDVGGETVEVLTTHWINESDIGDGSGPVMDSDLRALQSEASDRIHHWPTAIPDVRLIYPVRC